MCEVATRGGRGEELLTFTGSHIVGNGSGAPRLEARDFE
jgi:hypothetical protein